MSQSQKFTQEELDTINELREGNSEKITEFGQIELELLLTEQRLESLLKAKKDLKDHYNELQQKERNFVEKLNEKYGAGTVDLNSGEFIPSN